MASAPETPPPNNKSRAGGWALAAGAIMSITALIRLARACTPDPSHAALDLDHLTMPYGAPCASPESCTSGMCITNNITGMGYCTKACTTDADCLEGYRC